MNPVKLFYFSTKSSMVSKGLLSISNVPRMTRMWFAVFGALPTVLVFFLCLVDGRHWPNFSCLPFNATATQKRAVQHYEMGYGSCQQAFQKWKGKCDKICVLLNRDILIRTAKNGPFMFDIDKFMTILSQELGIPVDNPSDAEKGLMNKVRPGITECTKEHPEYASLDVRNAPCEPYNNMFQCIDTAVGC